MYECPLLYSSYNGHIKSVKRVFWWSIKSTGQNPWARRSHRNASNIARKCSTFLEVTSSDPRKRRYDRIREISAALERETDSPKTLWPSLPHIPLPRGYTPVWMSVCLRETVREIKAHRRIVIYSLSVPALWRRQVSRQTIVYCSSCFFLWSHMRRERNDL